MTKRDELLCAMFGCGAGDLRMLDDVEFPWHEVLEMLDWPDGGPVGFNTLMRGAIDLGIIHIRDAADAKIADLEDIQENTGLSAEQEKELEALLSLDPDNDFNLYLNFKDTHVWINKNKGIYEKYMQEDLEAFGHFTGIHIQP